MTKNGGKRLLRQGALRARSGCHYSSPLSFTRQLRRPCTMTSSVHLLSKMPRFLVCCPTQATPPATPQTRGRVHCRERQRNPLNSNGHRVSLSATTHARVCNKELSSAAHARFQETHQPKRYSELRGLGKSSNSSLELNPHER